MTPDIPLTPLLLKMISGLVEAGDSAAEIAEKLEIPQERVDTAFKALARAKELATPAE